MPTTIPHARRVRDAILQPHATASDAARWLSPVILGAEWPAWCATLNHLRAFARRAARAGHWWAPAEADALGSDDIATPEAWAATRERLHAAAHEHSDWGGVEAPVWGEPLCHASGGGREVWGVEADGGAVYEGSTRRGPDGWAYIVAISIADDEGATYAAALCPGEAAGRYLDGAEVRSPEGLGRRVLVTVRTSAGGSIVAVDVRDIPEGLPPGLAAHERHLDFSPPHVARALAAAAAGAMTATDAAEAIAWRDADRTRRAAEAAEFSAAHAILAQRAAEFLAEEADDV